MCTESTEKDIVGWTRPRTEYSDVSLSLLLSFFSRLEKRRERRKKKKKEISHSGKAPYIQTQSPDSILAERMTTSP